MRISARLRWAAAIAASSLALAACGGPTGADDGSVPPLTVHANTATTYQRNFNPFSPSANPGTKGLLYEPLMLHTPMKPGESQPWLAESMTFDDTGTAVTFVLREGVRWSDGEAFDADDVAFTFNLMRDNPAANLDALDLAGATVVDPRTVEVRFNTTAFAFEPQIGNTMVVPQHVFGGVDPVGFLNENPVDTGPFMLGTFSQQLYTLSRNPHYWNAANVKVEQVRYPAATDQTFNTSLQAGELDWAGGFVANIDQIFVRPDPENRGYWYPGDGLVNLLVNVGKAPFDDVAVRRAISAGIDRPQLSEVAMQGFTPPAHPTGLPLPAFKDAMSRKYADAKLVRDPAAANAMLDAAGYRRGADGVRTTPGGERMSYTLQVPSSYVDWVTVSQLLKEQLAAIGIEVLPQGVSFEAWLTGRNSGTYEMTIAAATLGLEPYDLYRKMLSSEYRSDRPTVVANFSRWYDPETDAHLAAFAATDDPAARQAALDGVQQIMVVELPVIPLLQSPNWFQYNTARWTGFPSEKSPYALGAPIQYPDNLLVLTHLTPAG